ncbi:LLM class flavin-dependent oxidoreductase [Agromyces aerolatus]|uniref:LLM class flavin-dependent oxidoreductase n=1 Tax=Agromyces sp. LY-1074 TaxID=3074080 RepID=UPI0028616BBB|nr:MULTISPECIES: LLM class flavin-dependent oxidoreductase [unclassified Agromyces]MDR5701599.1 LLM class flavin-dependent oxidoreductase [Agromyces sp. LY-1074]MDR5706129.1 LLM class flavin-dependent oxidoreductase [Agromyces sp. LY-1358]
MTRSSALPVELSINFPAFALDRIPALAQAAERAGFGALRVGDMQSTHRELYTALTVIAASTSRVRFGPGVTNPVTRHPAVAASAMATLHEFSGGRAVFGIGTGDSAVHNLGERSATVAELEAYIRAIRDLHSAGRAEYRDNTLVLEWWSGGPIPIVVSAHGPRMLRLAGRVADAVVVGLGMGEPAREYAAEQIEAGAREVGRDPASIEVWYLAYLNLGSTADDAAREVSSALAVGGNLLAKSAAKTIIPDPLRPRFAELASRYSYLQHAGGDASNPNARLIDELGLRDHLAEQFGVFGTPADVRARLDSLASAGVSRLWGAYVLPDLVDFFDRWRAGVSRQEP